ncbi:hypothetical protein AX16_004736 [Volvariella volvacea WC 439]|nr:hypothetical protein AX16_004736 [Volvariella volvacea WC 439]
MAPSPSSATTTSVQVALRIRPPTTQDSHSIPTRFQRSVIQALSPTSVSIEVTPTSALASSASASPASSSSNAKKQVFSFDQVHPPPTTQYELFSSTAQPLISRFVEGFNCTILAYGQTSSGKTFTMTGIDLDADPTDPNNGMGIIPRAVSTIFSRAQKLKEERRGAWTYSIKGSFIEIYNEDLIDLLTLDDPSGVRREVQIREDKGQIIWDGLREVTVRSASEVMNLIRKGTAIRRTNETDMNAQSSRSHAIFSLTLTQKKYTGSNPPRSSSPLPGGRSPSRLARPGSMYAGGPPSAARVSSPTFGRPGTPNSFAAAMGRGGLRPSSALGHTNDRAHPAGEEDGEWITIVSKFHFVDLAGSERLKRTAAAGERIKEGISINSGLLALGNVISALGDPARAKSHTATHIPYRDSKLTRLLQDSLGGNAHTLMIACVSPAEWNAAETVNTLKYANRARNIKNRAVVNEKEDGWDDVEWLQGTVTRLRKEVKALKEGGAIAADPTSSVASEGTTKRMISQMTELQNNYENLREKFVERTEELTRLRRELGERQRGNLNGAVSGTAKYEEIVGPVIEEYEKTISAMEAELSLNRAALRHTNELVEEKEEELATLSERHTATELYVEELRNRVSKLTEREASTEAYVRDLEDKIRSYDESSLTSSESMQDLKREIARFKDTEAYSSKYIADLEARLARSDESILSLQQTVETLEKEVERRQIEAETLQSRLDTLRSDGDNWRTDLEERERKVKELEFKMEEWERKRQEAGEARVRLGNVVGEVASARRSLELDLANAASGTTSGAMTPASSEIGERSNEASANTSLYETSLQSQLDALRQTHQATLADLSSVTAKYRDALREISDLAAQIQEAKLGTSTVDSNESPERYSDVPPTPRRRMTAGRQRDAEGQQNSASRRLFFREAASAESLHLRSLSQSQSQSLSQELSSVHLRKTSYSTGTGSSSHSPSNSYSPALNGLSRPNLSISLPSPALNGQERSVSSLEKEIMRLQEVLKEREAEISVLETSLRESRIAEAAAPTPPVDSKVKVNGHSADPDHTLSPKTLNQFDHIRKSMEHHNDQLSVDNGSDKNESSVYSETEDSLERLNELMLSMAQKESQHKEIVDDLTAQLTQTRRQLDELTALSRDQTLNMSNEIEGLRGRHAADLETLRQVQDREAELAKTLESVKQDHANAVKALRDEHEQALRAKGSEIDELLSRMKKNQEAHVTTLREELAAAAAALETAHHEHEAIFGKLKAEHEAELQRRVQEVESVLARTKDDHSKQIEKLIAEHAETLRRRDAEHTISLQTTEEEYYNALTKLRGDHAEALKKHAAETNATVDRLKEEHAAALRVAEMAREGSLSESQSATALAIQALQDEHNAAIARKETTFNEERELLSKQHERMLNEKEQDHIVQLGRVRSEHEVIISKLKEDWRIESDQMALELKSSADKITALEKARVETDDAVRAVQEQQAAVLQEIERGHEEDVSRLKAAHQTALKEAVSRIGKERASLVEAHEQALAELRSKHEADVIKLKKDIEVLKAQHEKEIHNLRSEADRKAEEEQARFASSLEALEKQHAEVVQKLRQEHESVVQVLDGLKTDAAQREESDIQEKARSASTLDEMSRRHEQEIKSLQSDYNSLLAKLELQELEASRSQQSLSDEATHLAQELGKLREQHSLEMEEASNSRDQLMQELEAYKAAADEYALKQEQTRQAREAALADKQQQIDSVTSERDELQAELAKLRAELDKTQNEQSKLIQEASKRESLVNELEHHRSILAEMQENLQKVKDEKDVLQTEKIKADTLVRDLQAQIARSSPPPHARSPDRPFARGPGSLPSKLPPPTPPPSVPPPPAPRPIGIHHTNSDLSTSSQGSSFVPSSFSSKESQPDSPSTSVGPASQYGAPDPKLLQRIEQQAKTIEEQEVMIKTLNKQLTHCETDLQTHMDLVGTLESSLGDSEKNLRKARMHATELARERDSLNGTIEALRSELNEAKREVVTVRKSIVEEKQSLEQKLDEERRAKERVRQQLDSRMEELQKRKSKFACL